MLLHNIKEKAKQCDITLADLERAADLSPNSIFRWGKVVPAADKLCRVASVLGTTSEELLGGRTNADEVFDHRRDASALRH